MCQTLKLKATEQQQQKKLTFHGAKKSNSESMQRRSKTTFNKNGISIKVYWFGPSDSASRLVRASSDKAKKYQIDEAEGKTNQTKYFPSLSTLMQSLNAFSRKKSLEHSFFRLFSVSRSFACFCSLVTHLQNELWNVGTIHTEIRERERASESKITSTTQMNIECNRWKPTVKFANVHILYQ